LGNKKRLQVLGDDDFMKKSVIVRGPALSRSGYGEHCRFLLRSLKEYQDYFDIHLLNVPWGKTNWLIEDNEERRWLDEIIQKTAILLQQTNNQPNFDLSLQVTIPNEWEKMAQVDIGVTAGIESNLVSPAWVAKSLEVSKIITISEHSKNVYENSSYEAKNEQTGEVFPNYRCQTPIDVVHYPVKKVETFDIDLGLDTEFNFLTVCQWGPRKNLENTIKWFVEEFIDQNVGLIVKTSYAKNTVIDRDWVKKSVLSLLKEYPDRKCKIHLLHGNLSEEEMHSIYVHPKVKALINIGHGEGFGLPVFEAAYSGLPVIAPEWSGYCDFMTMPIKDKKGKTKMKPAFATVKYSLQKIQQEAVWDGVLQADSMWAFAEQGSYKMRLRELYKDYNRFKSQAQKLQTFILDNWKEEDQYKKFVESILGHEVKKVAIDELPKISIITSIYNGDEYIRPYLEDITRQTIFKEKCELILINANSPGNEEEVIMEYKEKYPDNIVYRKLDEDPGIYGVWNMGVEMATGEFLTNANLDDRKAPNSLEMHAKALFTEEDVDLVYADMLITDQPNEVWEKNSSNGRKYNFPQFSFDNLKMVNMPHASPLWRASVHKKYGKFDEKYGSAGDWEMWLRAASQGSKFKKIESILGLYYFNPKGISTNPENFDWKQKEEAEVYEKYMDLELDEKAA